MDDKDKDTSNVNKIQKSVVLIHLKAIGEAPALKNAKFKIDGEKIVADVCINYYNSFKKNDIYICIFTLRKRIEINPFVPLYIYIYIYIFI